MTENSDLDCGTIVNVMSEGALLQLADGRINAANPSAERILGLSRQQLVGTYAADLPWRTVREDGSPFPHAEHPSMLALQTGRSCRDVIIGIDRPDGSPAWISVNAEPLFNPGASSPYAVVTTFTDVTRLKRHETENRELTALMLAIRAINEHLLTAQSEDELYRFICDTLHALDHVVAVWIGLNAANAAVKPVAWAGMNADNFAGKSFGCALLGAAIHEHAPVIRNVDADMPPQSWPETSRGTAVSGAGIPLFVDGKAIGGLAIFADQPAFFNETTTKFLGEVAGDIALGVKTLQLDRKLQATLGNLRESLDATIEAISGIVEYRDPYTAGHERRVAQLACAIGRELGLPERQIEGLRVAGHIHDLGKIAVPAEILSKPTRLTQAERQLVMEHAQTGYNLLKNLQFPWPIAQVVLQHHERLDGSGYPHGLTEADIIPEAKILMVADVVEAISGHRPYRPGLGTEQALTEIRNNRGRHYDPAAVDACLEVFTRNFAFDSRPAAQM